MTIVRNITFLFLLILVSCRERAMNDYEKAIIGEWTFVKETPEKQTGDFTLAILETSVDGCNFLPDNICENKLGYFKRIDGNERRDTKTLFLGTKTKYKVNGNRLRVLNLIDSSWFSQKIVSITKDTMTLQMNDSTFLKYARANYHLDDNEHYDEIIISASGCYGTCPINYIAINRNGKVIYFGDKYNTVNGLYKSKVSSTVFSKLEDAFKKANIGKLQDNYAARWTDDETISVTFIKNNRIVKSISDYGRQSPTEFYWAYTSARYLYQQIQLDKISNRLDCLPFNYTMLVAGEKFYELTQSEGFYLWTLILNSKETQKIFFGEYLIRNNWQREIQKLETDGQLFKFTLQDRSIKIYDLGFNFIKKNGLDKKLRSKNKY